MTSNGLLTMASHFGAYKLHYRREELNWQVPLSYLFIIMFEQIYQDREGKMITLTDREMIDSGEYDRQLSIKRMNRQNR